MLTVPRRLAHLAGFVILVLVLNGCGGGQVAPDQVIKVTGKVMRKGKPLPYAQVIFMPPSGNVRQALVCQSDGKGQFEFNHVPPGQYQVQLDVMLNGNPDPALEPYRAASPLKAEVTKDQTTFEFNADA